MRSLPLLARFRWKLVPVLGGGEHGHADPGDDYVVKPFSPREVVARSMAILRRTAARPPVVENVGVMRHGLLSLDTESCSLPPCPGLARSSCGFMKGNYIPN